jgi:hypothetical protein
LLTMVRGAGIEPASSHLKEKESNKRAYEHGIRYEFIDCDPISKVRQGGKRLSTATRLDASQLRQLLKALPNKGV